MKIALALHTMNPKTGGVMSATLQLAQALAARGHDVTLISFDAPQVPFLPALDKNISLITLGPTANAYGFVPQLEQKLLGKHFDFIILNGLWLYSTAGMARWAQRNRIPYALFPHGMLDPYFRRTHPLKHFKKLLYWFLVERNTVKNARAILYTTTSERQLAQHTFPFFHPQRQDVIGLGLESSPTPPESAKEIFLSHFPALRKKSFLLFLSRFHPKKGADLLLRALKDFPQLTLVMAGPLDDAHPKFLNELMKLAGPNVIWTDLLTGPAKWGALASADALILPSHQENFGMAVAEALSVGTPALVSTQVALAPDILRYQAGLVADDTLEGARQLLEQFCALTSEQKSSLRQNALRCYQENYLPDTVAQKLESLI